MAETLHVLRDSAVDITELRDAKSGTERGDELFEDAPPQRRGFFARWFGARRESSEAASQPAPPPAASPYATVFDNLLFLPEGRSVRTVIVAPATPLAASPSAIRGIAEEGERRGLRTVTARMEGSENELRIVTEYTAEHAQRANGSAEGAGPEACVEIHAREGEAGTARLDAWLSDTAARHDLVLIAGPPLVTSLRAAAIGARCDGLLILAEAGTTTRKDLRMAVTAVRARGCHTFGVFVNENPGKLARWLSEL